VVADGGVPQGQNLAGLELRSIEQVSPDTLKKRFTNKICTSDY
jgi:hypothetical protein